MPEEQKPAAAAAPSQQPAAAPVTPAKGKSNTALIVIIVLVVIFGVLIGGGYLVYHWVKGKVTTALDEGTITTTSGDGSKVTTSTSGTDDYSASKDLTPADDFGKGVNNDLKPILSTLYGGVKLNTVSSEASGAALYYLTKNEMKVENGQTISDELQKKGYTQDYISTGSDGFVLTVTKGTTSLVISGSGERTVGVIASVIESTN